MIVERVPGRNKLVVIMIQPTYYVEAGFVVVPVLSCLAKERVSISTDSFFNEPLPLLSCPHFHISPHIYGLLTIHRPHLG